MPPPSIALFRRSFDAITDALAEAGFRKRRTGILTLPVSADVLGWLGLNKGYDSATSVLRINPVVGIRYQKLERALASLLDQPFHDYIPASLSSPLGYLMPEKRFTTWPFTANDDPAPTAAMLAQAISNYGVPFIRRNATLEALYATVTSNPGIGIPTQVASRVPVLCLLLGKPGEAEQRVAAELSRMGNRDDQASRFYRRFAQALRQQIKKESGGP
ncbi:MAG TPA: hypothetical protein VLS53_05740 [Candidatus Dormibacteraeota bacterium]|nr:hypothetical protein [Candidatus Dormibacteraeota bacterium]